VSKEEIEGILQKAQADSHDLQSHDIHLVRITQLFDDKTGEPYSEEQLAEIHKKLDSRYQRNIPPGYKDAKKENSKQNDEELNIDKYGDGVVWFQMIDYARLHKKSIIFITDDVKEDWWRRVKGKILGPRSELIKEIFDEAGVSFYMYTADNFINRAQEFLNVQVQQTTIEEVRELRHQDEAIQNKAQAVASLFSELAGVATILHHREHIKEMEKMFGDRSTLAFMLKQGQETAKLVNSLGGIQQLNWLAEEARRAHQIFNNLGISSSFISNPVSDGKDADTTDIVLNQADQDIDNEEQ